MSTVERPRTGSIPPAPAMPRGKDPTAPEWKYTEVFEADHAESFFEEPAPSGEVKVMGTFGGRPIIGRDRRINGGVYGTSGFREALVVDDKKYPLLAHTYEEFLARLKAQSARKAKPINQLALDEAFNTARRLLRYDTDAVDRLNSRSGPIMSARPRKVDLSGFIAHGVGVCRHQALLSGYLLEKLGDGGYLGGFPSIDSNYVPGAGGHAWVRYVNSSGKIFILDPAQDYIGPLDKIAVKLGWFYNRPGERIK